MVGICCYTSVVAFTHILFFSFIRDFNVLLSVIMLIVWSLTPIVYAFIHFTKLEPALYRQVYTEIFGDGMFWLSTIITVGLMVIPFIAYRMIKDLIIFPEFNFS